MPESTGAGGRHPPGRSRRRTVSLLRRTLAGLLVAALLSACGTGPAITPQPVSSSTLFASPSLQTRAEGQVGSPCGPLWPEEVPVTLRGLYRTAGDKPYLDVLRVLPEGPPCWARFFLDRDLGPDRVDWENPPYIEVSGLASSTRWGSAGLWDLQVRRYAVLPLDGEAARNACRQAVAGRSAALQALDWSALALPAYVTGTAGFRPTAAELAAVTVQLQGADDEKPLLVLVARGPDLPAVRPLVSRWVSVECVYDIAAGQVVSLTATIRGEVQE